ncbi:MAG: cytochrome c-type biogenesis protein CcmH [Nitrospirae bacterium]|nr:cytochrome c-type biogenesis protein CcmH [Nitrospirota bacterium]
MKRLIRAAAAFALLGAASGVRSEESSAADPAVEKRVRALATELRCPVCQNLSVADSPSTMAVQMRSLIREEIEKGATEDQVRSFFVQKYGEWILLAPLKSGFNWLLWLGGPVLLLAGLVGIVFWVARRRRPIEDVPPVSAETAARIEKALKERLEDGA